MSAKLGIRALQAFQGCDGTGRVAGYCENWTASGAASMMLRRLTQNPQIGRRAFVRVSVYMSLTHPSRTITTEFWVTGSGNET